MRETHKSDGSAIDKAFTKVTSSGRIQIGHCDTNAIQHLESNSHSHIFRSLANSGGDNARACSVGIADTCHTSQRFGAAPTEWATDHATSKHVIASAPPDRFRHKSNGDNTAAKSTHSDATPDLSSDATANSNARKTTRARRSYSPSQQEGRLEFMSCRTTWDIFLMCATASRGRWRTFKSSNTAMTFVSFAGLFASVRHQTCPRLVGRYRL